MCKEASRGKESKERREYYEGGHRFREIGNRTLRIDQRKKEIDLKEIERLKEGWNRMR